jgi:lysophospholipase L1-like esterase
VKDNTLRQGLLYIAIIGVSVLFGFVFSESGYRLVLINQNPAEFASEDNIGDRASTGDRPSVWFLEKSRWNYHPKYGYAYGTETIRGGSAFGGKIQSCWYWPANNRGNMGLIRGDYNSADLKVLVFGDSFTAQVDTGLNPLGVTWPDFLQEYLTKETGLTVHVVNFGRDGTGLLHMVDLARDMVPKWKPDLVVFSFITDDFTRDRFFRTPTVIDGRERVLTTIINTRNPSLKDGTDTAIVHSGATKEWCEREQASVGPSDDPVLREMEATVLQAKAHGAGKPTVTTMDRSFLFDRFVHGTPFHTTYSRMLPTQNPRHKMMSFMEDARFTKGVESLKALGIPIASIHLSTYDELVKDEIMMGSNQDESLVRSLKPAFGNAVFYSAEYGKVAPDQLTKIKRSPNDTHPSVFGMQYYAAAVTRILIENGFASK